MTPTPVRTTPEDDTAEDDHGHDGNDEGAYPPPPAS